MKQIGTLSWNAIVLLAVTVVAVRESVAVLLGIVQRHIFVIWPGKWEFSPMREATPEGLAAAFAAAIIIVCITAVAMEYVQEDQELMDVGTGTLTGCVIMVVWVDTLPALIWVGCIVLLGLLCGLCMEDVQRFRGDRLFFMLIGTVIGIAVYVAAVYGLPCAAVVEFVLMSCLMVSTVGIIIVRYFWGKNVDDDY